MRTSPAHTDFIATAKRRLVGQSVISYIAAKNTGIEGPGTAPTLVLRAYPANFRNSPEATRRTMLLMQSLIWGSVGMPIIHRASTIVRASAIASNELLNAALFRWVRMNLVFKPDEELIAQGHEGRELLIAPDVLLQMNPAEGDCDDFSMVTAAVAISLNMRVKLVAVALEPHNPGRYSHIFTQVLDCDETGRQFWVTLDCSHGLYAGWEVQGQLARVELNV